MPWRRDPGSTPRTDPAVGLCSACSHCQRVQSARGSTFFLCRRAVDDPRYSRYPRLPIHSCPGFSGAGD